MPCKEKMETKNEKIQQFEAELRNLLAKPKITTADASKIEIMVYIAKQSQLIDMPDVSPDAFEKAREFYYTKATENQQAKMRKTYALLRSIDLMYRCYITRCYALRFAIERIDGIAWSLQQAEHIEKALLEEDIIQADKIQDFSDRHLNTLTSSQTTQEYTERLSELPSYMIEALCYYQVYKEAMNILEEVYKMPVLNLLVDDWETYEKAIKASQEAQIAIAEQIKYREDEKLLILQNVFSCLDNIKAERFELPKKIRQELKKRIVLESRKPNAQHVWSMMMAAVDFTDLLNRSN